MGFKYPYVIFGFVTRLVKHTENGSFNQDMGKYPKALHWKYLSVQFIVTKVFQSVLFLVLERTLLGISFTIAKFFSGTECIQ